MRTSETPTPPRINPWKKYVGSFIPNWLLCRPEVSQGAKLAYARLMQFAGRNGECFPKQQTLAAELGVSERMASDYIRILAKHKLIKIKRLGLGRSNRYSFLDHPWIPKDPAPIASSDSILQEPSGQQRQHSSPPTKDKNQGRESKEGGTQTMVSLPCSLPSSEVEAVKSAALHGVPSDFAREVFNHMEAVGWIEGNGRVVRKWEPYIKVRWAREQSQRAERAGRPPVKHRASASPSLNTVHPEQFTGAVGKL